LIWRRNHSAAWHWLAALGFGMATNLLFRWFVGLTMDEPVWDPTVFTKHRDRLLTQDVARRFFRHVVDHAQAVMSDEHLTVDGTLIEAWASQTSFQRKDGKTDGDGANFRGQQRRNDTHASTTDPDAKLYRKLNGAQSRLAYLGHLLIENRHGLIVDAMATQADGRAERDAALLMMQAQWMRAPWRRRTLGADKGYDVREFVDLTRERGTTPHVAQNLNRPGGSAIDARTTRHDGYAMSQRAPAHRTGVRLVENDRVDAQRQTARPGQGSLAVCLRECRVQRHPVAETAAHDGVRGDTCLRNRPWRRSADQYRGDSAADA
jgi:hypothetical protein